MSQGRSAPRACLVLLLFFPAFVLSAQSTDTFSVNFLSSTVSMDPLVSYTTTEAQVYTALYEGLVTYDPYSLDPIAARRVDRLIRQMSDELGVTSLVVSHDLTSIFTIADRIAMLYKGNMLLDGSARDFKASDNPVVQQYIHGWAEGPMEI